VKKASNAATKTTTAAEPKVVPGFLNGHEHIHAANCGHKSYVHGDHIDFEHDGHFHYVMNGKTYDCKGPNAKVIPLGKKTK